MTLIRLTALAFGLIAVPVLAATPPKSSKVTVVERKVEGIDMLASPDIGKIGATPETEALLSDCSGRKFETSVEVGIGPDARRTKIKLCSKPGQSNDEWIATLRDAATKIGGNLELAPTSRDKLVAAIEAEIARLKS